jgi:hypothetical protein
LILRLDCIIRRVGIIILKGVGSFLSAPSAARAGWVLLYVLCFADPTGAASADAHALNTARLGEEGAQVMSGGRKHIKFFEMNRSI